MIFNNIVISSIARRDCYNGETLENGVDYILKKVNTSDTFDKPGAFEVQLTGKGRFTGKAAMTFNIVPDEDNAAQAEVDALSEDIEEPNN